MALNQWLNLSFPNFVQNTKWVLLIKIWLLQTKVSKWQRLWSLFCYRQENFWASKMLFWCEKHSVTFWREKQTEPYLRTYQHKTYLIVFIDNFRIHSFSSLDFPSKQKNLPAAYFARLNRCNLLAWTVTAIITGRLISKKKEFETYFTFLFTLKFIFTAAFIWGWQKRRVLQWTRSLHHTPLK